MAEDGKKFGSSYISRFQYGILLSLGGMFLVYFKDQLGVIGMRNIIAAIGYLLTVGGFVIAGSGMGRYWRDFAARGKNDDG